LPDRGESPLAIVTVYKYPLGKGDRRDTSVFEFLRTLAHIWPKFTLFWYLNCRLHPVLVSDIHHYMTIVPLVKAGVLFREAELYRQHRIDRVDAV
jgi:hypothetical protein